MRVQVKKKHTGHLWQQAYIGCITRIWLRSNEEEARLREKVLSKIINPKRFQKSINSCGHKQIIAIYHIIKNKEVYKELLFQIEIANQRRTQRDIQNSVAKLRNLGLRVRLTRGA